MKSLYVILFACSLPYLAGAQDSLAVKVVDYSEPEGWVTSNRQAIETVGFSANGRVKGKEGYAVHLQTIIAGLDTVEGALANAQEDLLQENQGIPFHTIPSALTGYYRYYLPGSDTAMILVIFLKEGEVVSNDLLKIKNGIRQDEFLFFRMQLSLYDVPDRFIIAASASNLFSLKGAMNGSFIELDELRFEGTEEEIPNGNFNAWSVRTHSTYSSDYAGRK